MAQNSNMGKAFNKQKDCLQRASVLSAVHCLIAGIPAVFKALHYCNKTSIQTIQLTLNKHQAGVYINKSKLHSST